MTRSQATPPAFPRLLSIFALAAVGLPLACVEATNPFDPETAVDNQAKASVSGVVVDSLGVLEGATVRLKGQNEATSTTAADGLFAFDDLTPGVTTLEVSHPTHTTSFRDLFLVAGDVRGDLTVELQPLVEGALGTGVLRGTVLLGAQVGLPAAQQDHSGAIVDVVGTGQRTVTSTDGTFTFTVVPGTYDLAITATGHRPQSVAAQEVRADAETVAETITLAINPGVVVGVALLEGSSASETVHGGTLVSMGSSTTTTATDGTFRLTDLAAGTQPLRFVRDDHSLTERIVTVIAGADVDVGTVTLNRTRGSIVGRVDLVGQNDDSGVLVSLEGTAFAALSTTDGRFQIAGVPTGTYQVSATSAGFRSAASPIVTLAGDGDVVTVATIALVAAAGDFLVNNGAPFTNDPIVSLLVESDDASQMRISESPDFGDVALPVDFAETSSFELSDGDGTKTIFVELIDGEGLVLATLSASIILDTAPPENIAVVVDGGNAFSRDAAGRINLTLAATDAGTGVARMMVSTDGTFDTETLVDFSTSLVSFVDGNADGEATIAVRFEDRAGNLTAAADAAVATITLDRTPPVITSVVINNGDAFARTSVVSVAVTLDAASDDVTLMATSTDADVPNPAFQAFSQPFTFLLAPGEGLRSVGVRVQDAAGNIADAVDDDITVDLTAPAAPTVQLADGAAFTRTTTVPLSLSAQDFVEVRLSTDGNFDNSAPAETFSSTVPTSVVFAAGDGVKTVFAQFRDDAGNETGVVSDSITLDTAPPVLGTTPVSINAAASFTNSVSVTVSFAVTAATTMAIVADENPLATAVVVDDDDFSPFAATSVVLLPAGDCSVANCKRVCAVFRDAASNSTAQSCDQITLDGTVPSTPIFAEADLTQATKDVTLTLVSTPEDAFFSHLEILVDPTQASFVRFEPNNGGTNNVPFTVPSSFLRLPSEANITNPATGVARHLARFRAVDQAGNRSAETTLRITLDDVAPAAPTLAGLPNSQTGTSVVNADTVQVNFTFDNPADEDATFSHYLVTSTLVNAPTVTTQRDALIFTLVPNTLNVITIVAVDAAGNESVPATAEVREDSLEPSSPEITPSAGSVRANRVEIELVTESLDTTLGGGGGGGGFSANPVTVYELQDGLAGFRPVPGTGPFTATVRGKGTTEVCVRGRDDAGNVSIESCALITNSRQRSAVGVVDSPRAHDLFGDFVVYGSRSEVRVRDLRGSNDDLVLTQGIIDPDKMAAEGDIRVDGRGPVHKVVYDTREGAIAAIGFTMDNLEPQVQDRRLITGSKPDIHDDDLIYISGTSRLRRFAYVVAPSGGSPPGVLDPAPNQQEVGADLLAGAIEFCGGTGPRVFAKAIVWCEIIGGAPQARALRIDANGVRIGGPVTLSVNPLASGDDGALSGGSAEEAMPPVISDTHVAWVEDVDGVPTLAFVERDVRTNTFGSRVLTDLVVDELEDISGSFVVFLAIRDVLFNDVFAANLNRPDDGAVAITNDIPPQNDVSIDGPRVTWADVSAGDQILMLDRTDVRWFSATNELEFEPQTSTEATAWLSSRGNAVCLVGRLLPQESSTPFFFEEAPNVCEPVFFAGPAKSDPPWAVGGTRVAYLRPTGTPERFDLRMRDLDDEPGIGVSIANNIRATFAIDPDGDAIVYVDGNGAIVQEVLPPRLRDFVAARTQIEGPTTADIPHLDVDDGIVVYQDGGALEDRREPGTIRCRAAGGVFRAVQDRGTDLIARGPKVAKGRGFRPDLLAFAEVPFGGNPSARACVLNCSTTQAVCAAPSIPVSFGTGEDSAIRISRDGRIAYLTDETGLDQVAIFEFFSGSRFYLSAGADAQRSGVDLAEGRAVWVDPSLGTNDVWEFALP